MVNVLLIVYSVGHAITSGARQRALSALDSLTRPLATARLVVQASCLQDDTAGRMPAPQGIVPTSSLAIGDRIVVLPGELIPADGVIVSGQAMVRQTPFTGEWISAGPLSRRGTCWPEQRAKMDRW